MEEKYRRYYTELFTTGTFCNAIEDVNIKQKTIKLMWCGDRIVNRYSRVINSLCVCDVKMKNWSLGKHERNIT